MDTSSVWNLGKHFQEPAAACSYLPLFEMRRLLDHVVCVGRDGRFLYLSPESISARGQLELPPLRICYPKKRNPQHVETNKQAKAEARVRATPASKERRSAGLPREPAVRAGSLLHAAPTATRAPGGWPVLPELRQRFRWPV